jgi:GNAT superfamily N-acetyltransferase
MPKDVFIRSFHNSFCIGAIIDGRQVAYARLVTDYATFAYLADVYVLDEHRGKGISKEMIRLIFDMDWVKGLRRIMLATKDAHDLYRKVGFKSSNFPDRIMEIARPNLYGDMETRC